MFLQLSRLKYKSNLSGATTPTQVMPTVNTNCQGFCFFKTHHLTMRMCTLTSAFPSRPGPCPQPPRCSVRCSARIHGSTKMIITETVWCLSHSRPDLAGPPDRHSEPAQYHTGPGGSPWPRPGVDAGSHTAHLLRRGKRIPRRLPGTSPRGAGGLACRTGVKLG